jgi:Mn2+/Fe2+ NRAMP family transporter
VHHPVRESLLPLLVILGAMVAAHLTACLALAGALAQRQRSRLLPWRRVFLASFLTPVFLAPLVFFLRQWGVVVPHAHGELWELTAYFLVLIGSSVVAARLATPRRAP